MTVMLARKRWIDPSSRHQASRPRHAPPSSFSSPAPLTPDQAERAQQSADEKAGARAAEAAHEEKAAALDRLLFEQNRQEQQEDLDFARRYGLPPTREARTRYESKLRELTKIDYSNRAACLVCAIKSRCTKDYRKVSRLENEAVLDRMAARLKARPEILDRRLH